MSDIVEVSWPSSLQVDYAREALPLRATIDPVEQARPQADAQLPPGIQAKAFNLPDPTGPPRRPFSQDAFMSQLSRPDAPDHPQPPTAEAHPAPDDRPAGPGSPVAPKGLGLCTAAAQLWGGAPGPAVSEPGVPAGPEVGAPAGPEVGADGAGSSASGDGGKEARRLFTQDAYMSQLNRPAAADSGGKGAAEGGEAAAAGAGRRVFNKDGYMALLGRPGPAAGGVEGAGLGGRDSAASYLSSLQRYTDDGIRLSGVSRYSEEVHMRALASLLQPP